jgi:hypothetical protein
MYQLNTYINYLMYIFYALLKYMDGLSIIMIFLFLGAIGICIFLIMKNTKLTSSLINPKKCPVTQGQFGLRPGTSGASLLGCTDAPDGNTCVYTGQFDSLTSAVLKCNNMGGKCAAFAYTAQTNTLTIVDTSQPYVVASSTNASTDLYIRQYL